MGLDKEEVNWMIAKLVPAPLEIQRRMDDRVNAERYVEQEYKSKQGKCNFCGHETTRDFVATSVKQRQHSLP